MQIRKNEQGDLIVLLPESVAMIERMLSVLGSGKTVIQLIREMGITRQTAYKYMRLMQLNRMIRKVSTDYAGRMRVVVWADARSESDKNAAPSNARAVRGGDRAIQAQESILNWMKEHGPSTRAEISQGTGISSTYVRTCMAELMAIDAAYIKEKIGSTGGIGKLPWIYACGAGKTSEGGESEVIRTPSGSWKRQKVQHTELMARFFGMEVRA